MRHQKTSYVIAASTIALIALIFFQVTWLKDTRDLIEEQFNQNIQMALCLAVSNLEIQQVTCSSEGACCSPLEGFVGDFVLHTEETVSRETLDSSLAQAFDFYNIPLDFELSIQEESPSLIDASSFKCSVTPFNADDNHLVSLELLGKDRYIFGRMKFMLISSILISLFIVSVFIFANYTLLRQKQISQINKDFFNNMAHEFRTPLTNISLAGKLLAKKKHEGADKFLDVIDDESKKLSQQVDRILHLAKFENGEYQLEKEMINPAQLIRQTVTCMDLQLKEKEATINLHLDDENIQLSADKLHLGNVIRNLIDNALKYANQKPEIEITLKKHARGILIHVQDNGIGIGKQNQQVVFEKFHRVTHGNLHNQKGFGLGLAYVKMIVERHQGAINIFSDLKKGTRFDLFIPAS